MKKKSRKKGREKNRASKVRCIKMTQIGNDKVCFENLYGFNAIQYHA